MTTPRRGFTLIEFFAVVAILILIATTGTIIYQLFQQTNLLGAAKWGCLLISLGLSSATRSKK